MSTSVTCEAERTSSSSAARNSSFRPSPKAQARSSRAGRVVSGTVQNLVQALVGQRIFRGEPEVFSMQQQVRQKLTWLSIDSMCDKKWQTMLLGRDACSLQT
jgi:hypothetical protein